MDYDKDAHIERLEVINNALVEKLENMNRRKMARNDEATLKWRDKAFYWKRLYRKCMQEGENKNNQVKPEVKADEGVIGSSG